MNKDNKTLDLELEWKIPEVGSTIPLYGIITKIIEETEEQIILEINSNIILTSKISSNEIVYRNTIKERLFEYGIFIATIDSIDTDVKGTLKTVIFGKRQELDS